MQDLSEWRSATVAEMAQRIAMLTAENERLRSALQEVATDARCHCIEAYTRRGRHEPNALCYLADVADAALATGSKEQGK